MPTHSAIFALDAYASLFQRVMRLPVIWDVNEKKFVYWVNFKELRVWYGTMCFQLFATFCCLIVCLREVFVKETNVRSKEIVLVQAFLGIMSSMVGFGGGVLIFMDGPVGVASWENAIIVEKIVHEGIHNYVIYTLANNVTVFKSKCALN